METCRVQQQYRYETERSAEVLPFTTIKVTISVQLQLVKEKPEFYGTNPMLENYLVIHPKANSSDSSESNIVGEQ